MFKSLINLCGVERTCCEMADCARVETLNCGKRQLKASSQALLVTKKALHTEF